MNDLESRLRDSFDRQVAVSPALPDFPDTVVRRGRRARRARTTLSGAAVLALVAGGLVLAVEQQPQRQSLEPGTRPPMAVDALAPAGFVEGLPTAARDEQTMAYGVGPSAAFPAGDDKVGGLGGRVIAVQQAGDDVVYLVDDGAGRQQLGVLRSNGELDALVEDASGLAVDPTGVKVAYQPRHTTDLVVLEVATGGEVVRRDLGFAGAPMAWVGAEVLLSADDAGTHEVRAWSTVTGATRTVGGSTYGDVLGAARGSDLVALSRASDGCVTVSHLAERPDLWTDCGRSFVAFSPGGGSVLLRSGSGLVVRDALTGDVVGSPHVSAGGLLGVGLLDDDTVLALNRYRGSDGVIRVAATVCPAANDSACGLLRLFGDFQTAWVAGSRP